MAFFRHFHERHRAYALLADRPHDEGHRVRHVLVVGEAWASSMRRAHLLVSVGAMLPGRRCFLGGRL
jgi:hypothetical protein